LDKIIFAVSQLFVGGAISLAIVYGFVKSDLPQLPDNLSHILMRLPTEIYSSDGKLLRVLGERHLAPLSGISPHFQHAVIAAEDANFYRHHGIDRLSLLRAVMVNVKNGRVVQGASTITQQLSKNLFFNFEKSWTRKIKELFLAFQIESTYSKNEILAAYCSQVYFGSGVYGIKAASQYYFGKNAADLTLMQSAILAGVPRSPNTHNPASNLDRSLRRARHVLNRMVKEKYITIFEKQKALSSNIELASHKNRPDTNSYFTDYAVNLLEKKYGREFINFGGLRIFTTLNARMQSSAQKSVSEHLAFLKSKLKESEAEDLQTALVCIENKTGAVRAMVGGVDYARSQFNRAVSHNRMPGSSFKPFVYFSAMENLGYHPSTTLIDEPIVMDIPGTRTWRPKNFGDKYYGAVILKEALAKSLNIIAIKLVYRLTPKKVIATARRFGITSPLKPNYSIALGASGVSPLQMASAYSVIANLGDRKETFFVSRIEDYAGNRIYEHYSASDRRFSPAEMYPLVDMLQGVVENGSGRIVRRMGFNRPAGGKTGTTNDYKDAWFTGFTPHFTTSVWVGYDSNKGLARKNNVGLTGSQGAAPIWTLFMKDIHQGLDEADFRIPKGVTVKTVDKTTGQPAAKGAKNSLQVAERRPGRKGVVREPASALSANTPPMLDINSF